MIDWFQIIRRISVFCQKMFLLLGNPVIFLFAF